MVASAGVGVNSPLFRNGAAFGARAGWTWILISLGEIDFCAHVPKARAREICERRDMNEREWKMDMKSHEG